MTEEINDIKTYLLAKYNSFHKGFANVSKPNGENVILDELGQVYAGIADNQGNYFYIRSVKEPKFEAIRRGARIAYYRRLEVCRIVAVHTKSSEEDILQMLLNGISANGGVAKSADVERTRVFKTETGKDAGTIALPTLVAVDFELIGITRSNNCTLNPCNC